MTHSIKSTSKLNTNESTITTILLVISSLKLSSGGTAFEVVNLASLYAERESYRVVILTLNDRGPHYLIPNSVSVVRLDFSNLLAIVHNLFRYRETLHAANIIFVTGIWGLFDGFLFRLLRPKRTPYYIRVCGMLEEYILNKNQHKKMLAMLAYVNSNLQRSRALIVNSSPEKKHVLKLNYNQNVVVIRNWSKTPDVSIASSIARSSLNYGESDRILLYLGRIHPKKNLDKLLKVMLTLHEKNKTLPKLLIAGGFSDPTFERYVSSLFQKVAEVCDIKYIGEVSGIEKEIAFAAADVFILPSESEGLPNAVLEAMVRGLPVAITHGCNIPEIQSFKAGYCFYPNTPGFEDALGWVMSSPQVISKAGEAAKKLALTHFSKDAMLVSYNELLASSKR